MLCPAVKGPAVTRVLTRETSAEAVAVPPLLVGAVVLAVLGSASVSVGLALLSKPPAVPTRRSSDLVALAPGARLGMVQGRVEQPAPLTLVIVRLVGVSVTRMLVAGEG